MRLPFLGQQENKSKRQIVAFGGLNLSDNSHDGELRECTNLSSSQYPTLTQRDARLEIRTYKAPTAIFAVGKLCVVDGTDFIYDGVKVGDVTAGEKQLVSIGANIVIFPDKKYYNTATKTFGSLENTYVSEANKISFTGSSIITTGADFTGFKIGDAVEIKGCTVAAENNKTPIIRTIENKKLIFFDNTFTASTETAAITIKRKVPDLICVCESNNRLWGCADGQIMGCKLGDPFNWYVYDGLSTDAYAVAVGSDGDFTACIAYASHIVFFKENCVHKLFGNKPANYQLQHSSIFGVEAGGAGSLKIINETLFYKGKAGVYAYSGGIPALISDNFGRVRFSNATAETDGEKYYISMKHNDTYSIYVYDVMKNLWHKEDNTHVLGFARADGDLYFIDADTKKLFKRSGGKEQVTWSATFCKFTETMDERKCYSRLGARMELELGAYLQIEIRTDGGAWKLVYTTHDQRAMTIQVPIIPSRCDSFQVRFSGKGKCAIKLFTRTLQFGSEV